MPFLCVKPVSFALGLSLEASALASLDESAARFARTLSENSRPQKEPAHKLLGPLIAMLARGLVSGCVIWLKCLSLMSLLSLKCHPSSLPYPPEEGRGRDYVSPIQMILSLFLSFWFTFLDFTFPSLKSSQSEHVFPEQPQRLPRGHPSGPQRTTEHLVSQAPPAKKNKRLCENQVLAAMTAIRTLHATIKKVLIYVSFSCRHVSYLWWELLYIVLLFVIF